MNSIEIVMGTIQREHGTSIPRGELVIDREFAKDFINWRNGDLGADTFSDIELLLACCKVLKLDLVCIPAREGADNRRLLSPPTTDIGRITDEGLFVFWLVDGAFQSAMEEHGMMALMTALAKDPSAMGQELQRRSQQVVADIDRGVGTGAHGIIIADDIAYRQATYMSPDFVETYLLPIWQAQVNAAHELRVPVFFHSDGNLNAVLPYIVEAKFDGLQCIEPAAGMDIDSVNKRYGNMLCLMGNIDASLLCPPGDDTSNTTGIDHGLRSAVKEVMDIAVGKGGLIFGTCSGLHVGMRPEWVHYMYKEASKYI